MKSEWQVAGDINDFMSESDAVDALRLPFYSSRHARGSHVPGNQFDLGNTR